MKSHKVDALTLENLVSKNSMHANDRLNPLADILNLSAQSLKDFLVEDQQITKASLCGRIDINMSQSFINFDPHEENEQHLNVQINGNNHEAWELERQSLHYVEPRLSQLYLESLKQREEIK